MVIGCLLLCCRNFSFSATHRGLIQKNFYGVSQITEANWLPGLPAAKIAWSWAKRLCGYITSGHPTTTSTTLQILSTRFDIPDKLCSVFSMGEICHGNGKS